MEIAKLKDIGQLDDFYCGIDVFDEFIHAKGLERAVENNFCVPYKVYSKDKIIAFFALSCGSLTLDADSKDDFFMGYSNAGDVNIPAAYTETLKNKIHYPAIDIAYLAVREDYQRKKLGKDILKVIEQKIKQEFDFAGYQFLIVDAYCTKKYSTVTFYTKCQFTPYGRPIGDVVPMYKPLF